MSSVLSNTEVEVRENRLKTIIHYNGSLTDLEKKAKDGCLGCKDRSYSQCSSCMQGSASVILHYVRDAACVIHSPIGCVPNNLREQEQANLTSLARYGVPGKTNVVCTNISEKDTVYGGVEKLEAGVREAYQRFNPKAIFIQSSCAAGIVGDDIESVANEMADELGIPVVPVYCEGFKSKAWSSGFDAAFHGILRNIVVKPEKRQKDLVNIFNFCGSETFRPLLAKLGLRTNMLIPLADIDSIAHMSEAACASDVCETLGTYVTDVLEKEFGVRKVRSAPPYGLKWTDEWLRAVARETGKEDIVEDVIASEHKRIEPELNRLREELKGVRVYIFAGDAYAHNMASLAHDLGMETIGVTTLHHDVEQDNKGAVDTVEQLIDLVGEIDNFSVCNKQAYQVYKIVKELKPDLLIVRHGNMTIIGGKLGIPTLFEGDANLSVGYDGLISAGNRIKRILGIKGLVKTLAEYNEFPYSDWWNEQTDPYYFEEGHGNE